MKQLLAHFDRISDAPDTIPRLRQFILELAVRGKLVDRDANDEPASQLLKRIHAEKDRRNKNGQIKKQEALPQVRPDEAWFGVPGSWHWVRLGTITQVLMGQSPPGETYNKTGEGIPLINGPVEFTEGPFGKTVVNQYTTAPTNLCEEGDLLLCVRGSTTGRTNIAGFRACIGRGVAAIRPFFADQYVRLFIWRLRESIIAMGRGIAFPSVSRQQIEGLPVPLPPLAEQHRIVAKVDELMALCDRLEAAQAERENRRDRLAAVSLHGLNQLAATDEPEVFREHARFYLNQLPRLTTRPDQIKQIRQTILSLAVRGKLATQNPNDEPVSLLLDRIQTEKARLLKAGKIRGQELPSVVRDDIPIDLPQSWEWVPLARVLCSSFYGPRFGADEYCATGIPTIRTTDMTVDGRIVLRDPPRVSVPVDRLDDFKCEKGDLLITRTGSIGTMAVFGGGYEAIPSAYLIRLRFSASTRVDYIHVVLRSPYGQAALGLNTTKVAQPNINAKNLSAILIPLPPLAEQNRIVTKVEELMLLCDQLETQLKTIQTENRRLLESVLHEALAPAALQTL